jgi:hypothetical protein
MTKSQKNPKPPKFSIGETVIVFQDIKKGSQYRIPSNSKKNNWKHLSKGQIIAIDKPVTGKQNSVKYTVQSLDPSISPESTLYCTSSLLKYESEILNVQNIDSYSDLKTKSDQLREKLENYTKEIKQIEEQIKIADIKMNFYKSLGLDSINLTDERMLKVYNTYSDACDSRNEQLMDKSISFAKMLVEFDSNFHKAA